MYPERKNITYGAYARKSSEQEDRQVASIESQERELKELADRDGLKISLAFNESHSAKRPGRPIFNELVAAIERGEINGLLSWNPNRVSRNAIDTGVIIDLMDRDKLYEVRTPSQTYTNTPNDKFLFGLFCGQAKLENDNKGIDVKRGLRTKAQNGIYPAPAPIGYVNDRSAELGNKTILPDPERFDLVRKMFDLMLTGDYTPPQILKIANEEWGFRTARGYKMSRSTIYNVFTRPFYCGWFEYPSGSGNKHIGTHKPVISESEYRRVQSLLRKSGRSKESCDDKSLNFIYRGPIRCAECTAMITAEIKHKKLKNGSTRRYVYYHCTKRKDPSCKQPAIREECLEEQIGAFLKAIEVPPVFREWAVLQLSLDAPGRVTDRKSIIENLMKNIDRCERRLGSLIDLRVEGEVSQEEFAKKKRQLENEQEALHYQLDQMDHAREKVQKATEDLLELAETGYIQFTKGDAVSKRALHRSLGSNQTLRDKTLMLSDIPWVGPLKRLAREVRSIHAKNARFEPRKTHMYIGRMAELYAMNPRLLRAVDDVRTSIS